MKSTMKKFASLMMALIMLLSCSAAFALNLSEEYLGSGAGFVQNGVAGNESASQSTDVWLQVTADGQIDVTIPLVAVFKTNIDGGSATISESYKMVNNSTAPLKVVEVKVVDQKTNVSSNGVTSNLTMVAQLPNADSDVYDQYTLKITPTDHYASGTWTAAQNIGDTTTTSDHKFTKTGTDTPTYTLTKDTNETQGLWRIEKRGAASNADESYIKLELATSKLSFVTKKAADDKTTVENGVKMFNISYIVKIDDFGAVGGDIEDATTNHVYSYATPTSSK